MVTKIGKDNRFPVSQIKESNLHLVVQIQQWKAASEFSDVYKGTAAETFSIYD